VNAAIVDASVAVKWVIAENLAAEALLLRRIRFLTAPAHWLVEAGNAIWAKTMRGEITATEAEQRVAFLTEAPVVPVPSAELLAEALRLALELRHPVYDCLYLALAVRTNLPLITADRRLLDTTRRASLPITITWLGDLPELLERGAESTRS